MRSHNRPYVSNDNPYSESHFATAKQHPGFPKKFGGMVDGLTWAREFFPWYNESYHHSGLAFLTPAQVHYNNNYQVVLETRQAALHTVRNSGATSGNRGVGSGFSNGVEKFRVP